MWAWSLGLAPALATAPARAKSHQQRDGLVGVECHRGQPRVTGALPLSSISSPSPIYSWLTCWLCSHGPAQPAMPLAIPYLPFHIQSWCSPCRLPWSLSSNVSPLGEACPDRAGCSLRRHPPPRQGPACWGASRGISPHSHPCSPTRLSPLGAGSVALGTESSLHPHSLWLREEHTSPARFQLLHLPSQVPAICQTGRLVPTY